MELDYEVVQFIWSELFEKFSSFKITVRTVQLIWSELFAECSSFRWAVPIGEFVQRNFLNSSSDVNLSWTCLPLERSTGSSSSHVSGVPAPAHLTWARYLLQLISRERGTRSRSSHVSEVPAPAHLTWAGYPLPLISREWSTRSRSSHVSGVPAPAHLTWAGYPLQLISYERGTRSRSSHVSGELYTSSRTQVRAVVGLMPTTRYLMWHGPEETFESTREFYEFSKKQGKSSQSSIQLLYVESNEVVQFMSSRVWKDGKRTNSRYSNICSTFSQFPFSAQWNLFIPSFRTNWFTNNWMPSYIRILHKPNLPLRIHLLLMVSTFSLYFRYILEGIHIHVYRIYLVKVFLLN